MYNYQCCRMQELHGRLLTDDSLVHLHHDELRDFAELARPEVADMHICMEQDVIETAVAAFQRSLRQKEQGNCKPQSAAGLLHVACKPAILDPLLMMQ